MYGKVVARGAPVTRRRWGGGAAVLVTVLLVVSACADDGSNSTSASSRSSTTTGSASASQSSTTTGSASASQSSTTTGGGDPILAVAQAGGGSFEEAENGDYELTLTDVGDRAVWFTDRPARQAGSFSISAMNEAFFADGQNPPNAALEIFEASDGDDVVVVEISSPDYDEGAGTLKFDARLLDAAEVAGTELSHHGERAGTDAPSEFGRAALFVDDATDCSTPMGTAIGISGMDCAEVQEVFNALGPAFFASCIGKEHVALNGEYNGEDWSCSAEDGEALYLSFPDEKTFSIQY